MAGSDEHCEHRSAGSLNAFLAAWLGVPNEVEREALATCLVAIELRLQETWADDPPCVPEFWAELARCVPPDASADALASLHALELHLAFACRQGHPGALARFERDYMTMVGAAVARVDGSRTFVDEIKQRVRTKLLVSDGHGPAKLAHYTGRGDLGTWLRVVAVREALSAMRAEDRRLALAGDEELVAIEASNTGPELALLREQYSSEFKQAFATALAELEPAERNLLRLHYVHGLSIDEVGRLFHIHRSSAARRIVKVRETLLAGTRRALLARLTLPRRELEEWMALVASRLDLSIEGFLRSDER